MTSSSSVAEEVKKGKSTVTHKKKEREGSISLMALPQQLVTKMEVKN